MRQHDTSDIAANDNAPQGNTAYGNAHHNGSVNDNTADHGPETVAAGPLWMMAARVSDRGERPTKGRRTGHCR